MGLQLPNQPRPMERIPYVQGWSWITFWTYLTVLLPDAYHGQAFVYLQIRTQAGAVMQSLSNLSSLTWLTPTSTTCGSRL